MSNSAALGLQQAHRILAAFHRMPAMRYLRLARLTLLVMATLILLDGCGQKGSLYLPDKQQEEEEAS
jgi:hypothetical protein